MRAVPTLSLLVLTLAVAPCGDAGPTATDLRLAELMPYRSSSASGCR